MVNRELLDRLKEFMEHEARSCSMDMGGITPIYVYRMFGGQYPMQDIEAALIQCKKELYV